MTDNPKHLRVQATRSFNEYIQGAAYLIDSQDEAAMTLLGAGYFSEEHNPNLTVEEYAESGVLYGPDGGNGFSMAEQEHVNVDAGYQPANDVTVPEKMTGSQRATTADEELADGTVGTRQAGDSDGSTVRRSATRKSSGSRDN